MEDVLKRIRAVADYQFGKGIGIRLFPENVDVIYSKKTGRVRYVYLHGERLATLKPTNGLFSLSIVGAKRIVENSDSTKLLVTVMNDVSQFVARGGDVFAKHVVKAHRDIRPKDEVIAVNENREVLATGRAVLSGDEMIAFQQGVAVKTRHGCLDES